MYFLHLCTIFGWGFVYGFTSDGFQGDLSAENLRHRCLTTTGHYLQFRFWFLISVRQVHSLYEVFSEFGSFICECVQV